MATPEKQPPYPPLARQTPSLPPNFARHAGGYCCQIDYTGQVHFSGCVWMAGNLETATWTTDGIVEQDITSMQPGTSPERERLLYWDKNALHIRLLVRAHLIYLLALRRKKSPDQKE
jgi:hypothetical protein